MTSPDDDAAAERRAARSRTWTAQVFRSGDPREMADADLHFWLAIPPDERATVVWQLSVEAFGLAEGDERRLSRSHSCIVRR